MLARTCANIKKSDATMEQIVKKINDLVKNSNVSKIDDGIKIEFINKEEESCITIYHFISSKHHYHLDAEMNQYNQDIIKLICIEFGGIYLANDNQGEVPIKIEKGGKMKWLKI